jgi:DNA-binding transcriptional regulator WhiA
MNAMKNKVDIKDFLTLINWVKTFFVFERKTFNHENLLEQAETYRLNNTPLDTNIHHIDGFMIDAYRIYVRFKETEEKISQILDTVQIPFVSKDMMMDEVKKYERIFEDLMENYKYEDPEIRGIQKGFLNEKMKEYVAVEDYENAARLRDMIKEC